MELWSFAVYAVLLFSMRSADAGVHSDSSAAAVKLLFEVDAKVSPNVSIACVLEHCLTQSTGCLLDGTCRDALICSSKCLNEWDNDTTPEKFHVQNCTNVCAFSYNDKTYDNFMGCLSDHKCISFPPIPNTCQAHVHPIKKLSLEDVKGDWWVVKGYHPVYDCYPCQHVNFAPINQSIWSYEPKYEVYLTDGSLLLVSQEMFFPNSAPGTNISFVYHDVGLEHFETWWLIDKADDGAYVQVYYCGNTLQWYYEGALVLARNRTLSEADYAAITTSFKKAVGLNLADFCNPSTSETCPD